MCLTALALLIGSAAQAQDRPLPPGSVLPGPVSPTLTPAPILTQAPPPVPAPKTDAGGQITVGEVPPQDEPAATEGPLGPTPLLDVKILQDLLFGDNPKPWLHIAGWIDADYTYRSTGSGLNRTAPEMNRFGNEFLNRSDGLYLWKALDPTCWSWGFNAIFIAGADASFIGPTAGGWRNTDPRFGTSFTDLNLTAHLPILTDGGVDIKAGRQTTQLGPMGALPWQRYFDSSDYAWYNMEEGRYTGVSAVWHINKRLDWYNGIEVGGWGVFFDDPSHSVDYITNITYWLDEDAKKAKVWLTVLTGPTDFVFPGMHGENTTTTELGLLENWTTRFYQIIDFQAVYSKAPLGIPGSIAPADLPLRPGYQERAYDVYTYLGYHLTKCLDINTRFEWYKDVDGGGYPGGFGVPHNNYYAITAGPDIHPNKWVQFRPEIRYDWADKPNFGANYDKKDQLSIAAEVLLKF